MGHGKRMSQLRSLAENTPPQKCQCSDNAWCSRINDAGELMALADARDGMVIELTLIDGMWHGVHTVDGRPDPYIECLFDTHRVALPFTNHADEKMLLEYRTELAKTWPNHEVKFDFERNLRVPPRRRRNIC